MSLGKETSTFRKDSDELIINFGDNLITTRRTVLLLFLSVKYYSRIYGMYNSGVVSDLCFYTNLKDVAKREGEPFFSV